MYRRPAARNGVSFLIDQGITLSLHSLLSLRIEQYRCYNRLTNSHSINSELTATRELYATTYFCPMRPKVLISPPHIISRHFACIPILIGSLNKNTTYWSCLAMVYATILIRFAIKSQRSQLYVLLIKKKRRHHTQQCIAPYRPEADFHLPHNRNLLVAE